MAVSKLCFCIFKKTSGRNGCSFNLTEPSYVGELEIVGSCSDIQL